MFYGIFNEQRLVAKLWKYCDNARDGGVSYQNYVNELASRFEKMCKETGREADYLPEGYRWDDLKSRVWGAVAFYRNLLVHLGADEKKRCRRCSRTSTPPSQPKQLTELVSGMDSLDWYNGAFAAVPR
ncbi:SAM-dependent DNA methyltransferase [Salmonella enterica subsp. enterica serovar Weltevreden]|nr:SAM-dependent DNA methyltransferase [Salmonella enterica subsp. enterica serovar Weltevreden]